MQVESNQSRSTVLSNGISGETNVDKYYTPLTNRAKFVSVRILIAKIAIKLKSIGHVTAFKIDFVLRLSTRFYTILL